MNVYLFPALLLGCLVTRGVAAVDSQTQDLAQNVVALLTEERLLRAKLETQADLLERELNDLQTARQNVTCGCPMSMAPIAFSVLLTTDITNLGTTQEVHFDHVVTNVGQGYDLRHGEFTAPVHGVYDFTVAMMVPGGYWCGVEIVKNGVAMAKTRSGDNAYYTMGTTSVALELNAGDDVWVRHIAETDSNRIYGHLYSSFSGYLIEG